MSESFSVSGSASPTDEEAVAIMAATEALWPRAAVLGPVTEPRNTVWRFSSRSWSDRCQCAGFGPGVDPGLTMA